MQAGGRCRVASAVLGTGSKHHASILVVEDMSGAVFGGFVVEPWRVHPNYFGHGQTFVFTFHPTFQVNVD